MTSDKREKVAERLLVVAARPDVDGDVCVDDVLAALGVSVGCYEGYVAAESVVDLADLIDPTCGLIDRSDISGEPMVCSCCGKMLNRNIRWHYCPSCGARVASGNE